MFGSIPLFPGLKELTIFQSASMETPVFGPCAPEPKAVYRMSTRIPGLTSPITSVAGVAFYSVIAPFYTNIGPVAPDWALGALFGIGGFCGMYFGARLQKFFSARVIRIGLGVVISFLALRYIVGFFTG